MVGRHPVDASDHLLVRRGPAAAQHANGVDGGELGDTIRRARDRAGDMGSVAIAVVGLPETAEGAEPNHHAPGQLDMGGPDAAVDDVDVGPHPRASEMVQAVQRQKSLVETVEPP